jgi:hypothetical protein
LITFKGVKAMEAEQLIHQIDNVVFHKTQRHLRDIEVWILKESWHGKTYEEIAAQYNYTTQYLCQDIGPKLWKLLSEVFEETVGKRNFRTCLERSLNRNFLDVKDSFQHQISVPPFVPEVSLGREVTLAPRDASVANCDWADAPDIEPFYGQDKALQTLRQSVIGATDAQHQHQSPRLLVLTGMGGMGKTKLALKLSHQLLKDFDFVVWRSLRNGATVNQIVDSWLNAFSAGQSRLTGQSLEDKIHDLLCYLRKNRCLLILDNFDSVIAKDSAIGAYQPAHEGYGFLLRCLADSQHKSCLIITTREQPQGLAQRQGHSGSVKIFPMNGVNAEVAEQILRDKGCFQINEAGIQSILQYYGGNPLLINMIGASIREMIGGCVEEFLPFLQRGLFYSHDIWDLIQQHTHSLSDTQKQLLRWIANQSGQSTLPELLASCKVIPEHQILAGVQALLKRSLLARVEDSLHLLPFIAEYVLQQLLIDGEKTAWPSQRSLAVSALPMHSSELEKTFGKKVAA